MAERTSIYFDAAQWAELRHIAGPFGAVGRVVTLALRDGRGVSDGRQRAMLREQVNVRLHPVTVARVQAYADECGVSWQEAARRVVERWVEERGARVAA